MLLEIPDHIAKHITQNKKGLILEFAIFLYEQEILSMRAAADFARISWVEFEQILAKRNIALAELRAPYGGAVKGDLWAEIYVNLEGLIDFKMELLRLEANQAKLNEGVTKLKRKLENPNMVLDPVKRIDLGDCG